MIQKELQILITALVFYTRIPCYKYCQYKPEYIDESIKYLPFIGWIVGGVGTLVFLLSNLFFPLSISIIISMISTILLTGAFHEDGFADFCDGFGGGYNKEQILNIMKDSRIGSYALIGMISLLGLKYASLYNIQTHLIPFVLIAGHSISRFINATFIFSLEYVRKNDDSRKSTDKPDSTPFITLFIAGIFGLLPIIIFDIKYLFALIPLFITMQIFRIYLKKKIGGYTGDCLGAIQQLSEVIFYLSVIIINSYIA